MCLLVHPSRCFLKNTFNFPPRDITKHSSASPTHPTLPFASAKFGKLSSSPSSLSYPTSRRLTILKNIYLAKLSRHRDISVSLERHREEKRKKANKQKDFLLTASLIKFTNLFVATAWSRALGDFYFQKRYKCEDDEKKSSLNVIRYFWGIT